MRFGASYNSTLLFHVVCDRLRSHVLTLRGCTQGGKCRVGARVRVDNPHKLALGFRCQVEEQVWFKLVEPKAQISVGNYTFIGRGSEFDVLDHVTIGNHVLIAPGVFISDHGHNIASGSLIASQECTFVRSLQRNQ